MTPAEFAKWRALEAIEPFTARRSDIQTALIVQSVRMAFGSSGGRPPALEDFIVKWWREEGSDGG